MTKSPLPSEAPDSPPTTDLDELVRDAVAAALDRKAEAMRVLEIGAVTQFTDYFLICSGINPRQVQAIADAVDERLRQQKVRPLHVEGYQGGQWVLMDYGDFVLHVFHDDRRQFYGLERLWSDAPDHTSRFVPEP
ncbi:MAG TPA: ribosome silencing factor [Thermoanaerobaculia bacterium]|nr:ribosome silencing factor [Thermoanaerobaculia bacterium]